MATRASAPEVIATIVGVLQQWYCVRGRHYTTGAKSSRRRATCVNCERRIQQFRRMGPDQRDRCDH